MIDKLKLQDGGGSEYQYLDEDGVSWKNKSEYLQMEILGFCGCGNPDEVMIYVKNYLQDCKDSKFGSYEDTPYMFLAYWADHNGYTEHGTTVRCSWLTDKGKELLSDINWCLENEPN